MLILVHMGIDVDLSMGIHTYLSIGAYVNPSMDITARLIR